MSRSRAPRPARSLWEGCGLAQREYSAVTHIVFFKLGLDAPTTRAWFSGVYGAFFEALRRSGCEVALSFSTPLPAADVLVVPLGGGQDQDAARAMAAFPGPVVLYAPASRGWFRQDYLERWRHKILFAFGADESHYARRCYAQLGIPYHGLPLASDPAVMRPLGLEPRYDAVFVGDAQGARKMPFASAVAEALGPERVLLVGPGWDALGFPAQSIAWGSLLNVVYNLARVCLNIHAEGQYDEPEARLDANNRLFDLAMAGRCQVSNGHAVVSRYFDRTETATADTPSEFADLVRHFVAHPAEANALGQAARSKSLAAHTWDHRARLLVGWLEDGLAAWDPKGLSDRSRPDIGQLRDIYLPPYGPREFGRMLRGRATQHLHRRRR